MRIALASDIHSRDGKLIPDIPDCDLIVFAGDIGDPYIISKRVAEITKAPVVYVAGNHEYYGYHFDDVRKNVFNNTGGCYERTAIKIDDITIHACTLWSGLYSPMDILVYDHQLNDRRMIQGWDGNRSLIEHEMSMAYLDLYVNEGDIVVTHHSPSFQGVVEKFRGDVLNPCFHTDLDRFIEQKKPALWLHGHIHDPVDYVIGDTRIVCHPRGYHFERVGKSEYNFKIIDI